MAKASTINSVIAWFLIISNFIVLAVKVPFTDEYPYFFKVSVVISFLGIGIAWNIWKGHWEICIVSYMALGAISLYTALYLAISYEQIKVFGNDWLFSSSVSLKWRFICSLAIFVC